MTTELSGRRSSGGRILQQFVIPDVTVQRPLNLIHMRPGSGTRVRSELLTQLKINVCIWGRVYEKPCLFPHTKRFLTLIYQSSDDFVAL